MAVSYEQIKDKNYSFSAGQYFDVKIEYSDITPKRFTASGRFQNNLNSLFAESKDLEKEKAIGRVEVLVKQSSCRRLNMFQKENQCK